MPRNDLTGKKIGYLTVIKQDTSKPKGGARYWICQCECGRQVSVRSSSLTSSTRPTQSCGCLTKKVNTQIKNIDTLTGKVFNRLTVLDRDLTKPTGHGKSSYWNCKCQCGNIISVSYSNLTNGTTQSCGCLRKDMLTQRNIKDLTNKRFGMVVAKERLEIKNNHNCFLWRCECDCGNLNYICSTENLTSGKVNSCGCNKKSKGELIINNILIENNINFAREYSFNELRSESNRLLRFDFAIFNNENEIIRLVEFDGEQHFLPNESWGGEETFKLTQKHDQLKNNFSKEKNIPLVRIPYTKLADLNIDLIMGDEYLI